MPQAPLSSPTVDPSSGGTPTVNMAVPTEAFGGAAAHALSQLGGAVEGASDKIWQRAVELQNLDNDTKAKQADTDYMTKAGLLHAEFSSLEGDAAKAAFPKYIADLKSARESIRGGLSNPMVQKVYDASSMNVMGRSIFNGAGHAAQQAKVAASNASQSRVDTISNGIGAVPEDEEGFQKGISAIRAETASQGKLHGWQPDQTEETTRTNISTAVSKRIVGLARTDPFAAQSMFDSASNAKVLNPNDAAKVQATIQTQSRQVISRNVSSKINSDLDQPAPEGVPEKSLEDRIAEAKANPDVQRFAKNDPLLPDFVEQRVIADFNRYKSIQRDADQRNEQTVGSALMTGNREGILPKSVDELKLINPEVATAWDSLKPTTQRKYMSLLADNAKDEKITWNNDNLKTYQSLKGMAVDNPVEFLSKDVVSQPLPNSAKRELINLQTRLRSQSESDPRVARAMSILAPEIQNAGISKKSDVDQYYRFTGGLADALDAFQKDNKKVPTIDDVRKIGAQLMQQQTTDKGWLWDSKSATFDIPIPEDKAKEIKADPYWARNNIIPNDAMIRRIHAAQEYKRLYGGASSKPTT